MMGIEWAGWEVRWQGLDDRQRVHVGALLAKNGWQLHLWAAL